MIKTTVKIEGMMCKNCERHVTEALEKAFETKKVTSSHKDGESVILSETAPDPAKLEETVKAAGYTFVSASSEEKKGLFG